MRRVDVRCRHRSGMSDAGERRLRPRARDSRPVLHLGSKESESLKAAPEKCDLGWRIETPVSSRLWQKSALGMTVDNGAIILKPSEVLYCHWHRNIALPSTDFIAQMLSADERFLHESVALEAVRLGGEILLLQQGKQDFGKIHPETWGLRWDRTDHPSKGPPIAQVRWFISTDTLNLENVLDWVDYVEEQGQRAEVVVVDPEYDCTIYLMTRANPVGNMQAPSKINSDEWNKIHDLLKKSTQGAEGIFINSLEWPLQNLGLKQAGGVCLDNVEASWLETKVAGGTLTGEVHILDSLLEQGLLARPGFKYGCKWRVYDSPVGEGHAPWLLSTPEQKPRSWDEACLRARLAAGVNKLWISAMLLQEELVFLGMERILLGR